MKNQGLINFNSFLLGIIAVFITVGLFNQAKKENASVNNSAVNIAKKTKAQQKQFQSRNEKGRQ